MFPSAQKKNKSSTIPFSAQTEGKTLRAPIIRAARCRVRPYTKVSCKPGGVPDPAPQNTAWRQKCPKTEFSAGKRRESTRAWGTFLTRCRRRWAWPGWLPSKLKNLVPGFCNHLSLTFPRRATTRTASCSEKRRGLFLCSAPDFET